MQPEQRVYRNSQQSIAQTVSVGMNQHRIIWDDEDDEQTNNPKSTESAVPHNKNQYPIFEDSGSLTRLSTPVGAAVSLESSVSSSRISNLGLSIHMQNENVEDEENLPRFGNPPSTIQKPGNPKQTLISEPSHSSYAKQQEAIRLFNTFGDQSSLKQEQHKAHLPDSASSDVNLNKKIVAPSNSNSTGPNSFSKHKKGMLSPQRITQIEIILQKSLLEARSSNQEIFSKEINSQYLEYMQRYFLYMFDIIIPFHDPQVWKQQWLEVYLHYYFRYLVENHPQQLYLFFKNETFKGQEQTVTEPAESSYSSFYSQKVKQYLWTNLQSGIQKLSSQLKTVLRIEEEPQQQRLKILKNWLLKSAYLAQVSSNIRNKLNQQYNLVGGKIAQESLDRRQLNQSLAAVEWMQGFSSSVLFVRNLIESENEKVLTDKFSRHLEKFRGIIDEQFKQKGKQLESTIRKMHSRFSDRKK